MIDFVVSIWNNFIYIPVYNLLIFTYNITPGPNLGLAIIGIDVFIRFIFLYFTLRGYEQDKVLEKVKPEMEKIDEDEKLTSREKYQKIAQLTKPHGINPFFESVPIFAQLLFLVALYQIIQFGIDPSGFTNLYRFVGQPDFINTEFLGRDITNPVAIFSAAAAGMLMIERIWEYNEKKSGMKNISQRWDPLILPLLTFIILMFLPSTKAIFVATSISFSLAIKTIMYLGKLKKAKI